MYIPLEIVLMRCRQCCKCCLYDQWPLLCLLHHAMGSAIAATCLLVFGASGQHSASASIATCVDTCNALPLSLVMYQLPWSWWPWS